jgi:thiazole synthase ThiGH ThiG subunit
LKVFKNVLIFIENFFSKVYFTFLIISEMNGHVIGDGGCTTPADVCKAIAAGAHFVMVCEKIAEANLFKKMDRSFAFSHTHPSFPS